MQKLLIPLLFVAIALGLYEQSKDHPNIYILCAAVVVFMFGMMKLGSKVSSKNDDEEEASDDK